MELFSKYSALYLIMCLGICQNKVNHVHRIINGYLAFPGQYPFQISLQKHGEHKCGGTLISSNWVLTAAHCFLRRNQIDTSTDALSILAGTNDLQGWGVHRKIIRVVVNGFVPREMLNDIALLQLEKPIQFNRFIQPVRLPVNETILNEGKVATVIGWGKTEYDESVPPLLQTVNILVYSTRTCASLVSREPHPDAICAGLIHGGKGACVGDSGGPLLIDGIQEGIVSWGSKDCVQMPHPLGVYTNVEKYMKWILAVTGIQIA